MSDHVNDPIKVWSWKWCRQQVRPILEAELFSIPSEERTVNDYKYILEKYKKQKYGGVTWKLDQCIRKSVFYYMQKHVDKRLRKWMSIEDILNR